MVHVKEEMSRRWMYSGQRPDRIAACLNRGTAAVVAAGIGPKRMATLEVRGRRSGHALSCPVVLADYEGQRYLVAMLGTKANRVRNGRAAGGEAVLRHDRRERVCLEDVEPAARAPILQRYLQVAPGPRSHPGRAPRPPRPVSKTSPRNTPYSASPPSPAHHASRTTRRQCR